LLFTTDKTSSDYLALNSCGIEMISAYDRGSERPDGRRDYHILYVERGICHVRMEGVWQAVSEGGIILFRPGEPQIYYYDKQDESISHYLHFTGVGCGELLEQLGIGELRIFMMGRVKEYEEISERMTYEYSVRSRFWESFCAAYLHEMLNIIARHYERRNESFNQLSERRINAACRRIYENLAAVPDADTLAAEFCLSRSRFTHLFREVTGKSLTEFVQSLRMTRAAELLVSSELSVREVAEAVGIFDQNYFSRCFSKHIGISPREYRQRELDGR